MRHMAPAPQVYLFEGWKQDDLRHKLRANLLIYVASALRQTYRMMSWLINIQSAVTSITSSYSAGAPSASSDNILSFLLTEDIAYLINELTIPERACGGGGIKNKQKSSMRREVTSKVHCPQRKWLFCCLVSDIPSSLSAMENVLFFCPQWIWVEKKKNTWTLSY